MSSVCSLIMTWERLPWCFLSAFLCCFYFRDSKFPHFCDLLVSLEQCSLGGAALALPFCLLVLLLLQRFQISAFL
ncbi:hypothetical protein BRADI_2g08093v3 [Brachypodium distachyon]|uniref:Uncharacterized protein n=1 Tax=Brachypodium distachyon TaxID=15368 RepID=A0A0Q3ISS8_BRADI|nr:hypothetical protein BRADI_2g08093v3 [Brachypodium distachyon]